MNARQKLIETDSGKLFDKLGRAYGILQNSHLLTSGEAMNLLSLVRLGVDLKMYPESCRSIIDRHSMNYYTYLYALLENLQT